MSASYPCRIGALLLLALLPARLALAQFRTQFIEPENCCVGRSGVKAVFIEVEPLDPDPSAVFAGLDYESVWTYLPEPEREGSDRWLVHYRNGPDFLNTLERIQGGRGYLIVARSDGPLAIRGRPVNRSPVLRGGEFNLFGGEASADDPPSFADQFSHPNARGKIRSIVGLRDGRLQELVDGSRMAPGKAYFVLPDTDIVGARPIQIQGPPGGVLIQDENRPVPLRFELAARPTPRFVSIKLLEDEEGEEEPGEGFQIRDPASGEFRPLGEGVSIQIDANVALATVLLRAVRPSSTAALANKGVVDRSATELVTGIIEITDDDGNVATIGATFQSEPLEGLWVGEIELDEVSTHSAVQDPPVLAPAHPFYASLILRIPPSGALEILPRASFQGVRDGRPFEQRLEAALFHRAITLAGSPGAGGKSGILTGSIQMGAADPLNPYRHRYHPEHRLGYDIERSIVLRLGDTDPDPDRERLRQLGLQAEGLLGTYEEEIAGLSTESIVVRGSFRLRRVASAAAGP